MNYYITYFWKEWYLDDVYVFQSNDPAVCKRMRQRKDFKKIGIKMAWDYSMFKTQKKTPQSALRTLARITRSKVKKDAKNDVYFAITYTIVAPKNKPEV